MRRSGDDGEAAMAPGLQPVLEEADGGEEEKDGKEDDYRPRWAKHCIV